MNEKDFCKIMFEGNIDSFLTTNKNYSRLDFLDYQIKMEKMLENLLIVWQYLEKYSVEEFKEKSKASIFANVLREAKELDLHPVDVFNYNLTTEEKIKLLKLYS